MERVFKPIGELSGLTNHVILDRGRIIGLWEYDTATGSIMKKDKSLQDEVARTEKYVREQTRRCAFVQLRQPEVPRAKYRSIAQS